MELKMATELELAKNRLYSENGLSVRNIKLFPGSSRDVTPEKIANQINIAISHIEAGDIDKEEITAQ